MGVAVEELIREAQREGKFDNLPGRGRPLQLDTSPDAVVKGLLRQANYTPEWIEVAIAADGHWEASERFLEEYAGAHAAGWAELVGWNVLAEGDDNQPLSYFALRDFGKNRKFKAGQLADPSPPTPLPEQERGARRSLPGQLRLCLNTLRNGRKHPDIAAFNRRWELALARYTSLLQSADSCTRRYNRLVPLARYERKVVPVRALRETFAARFPLARPGVDGAIEGYTGSVSLLPMALWRNDICAVERNRYRLALVGSRRHKRAGWTQF